MTTTRHEGDLLELAAQEHSGFVQLTPEQYDAMDALLATFGLNSARTMGLVVIPGCPVYAEVTTGPWHYNEDGHVIRDTEVLEINPRGSEL